MSAHFEQELDALRQRLLSMASQAETAVRRALKALVDRDDDLARTVEEEDEILDQLEIELDETAIALLAKAPLATQLRLITVVMKVAHDLERVGDEATTISRRAREINAEPQLKEYVDIPRMAQLGLRMLHEALDAFVNQDSAKARAIIPQDKEVDQINKKLQQELAQYIVNRPDTITTCLNLMVISKSLERIADHATNLAEEVVYLYEGCDIRHDPTVKHGSPPREGGRNG